MAKKNKTVKKHSFNFHKLLVITLSALAFALIIGLINEHNPGMIGKQIAKTQEVIKKESQNRGKPVDEKKTTEKKETVKPAKKKETATTAAIKEKTKLTETKPAPSQAEPLFDIRKVKELDVPAPLNKRQEQVIRHSGYTVSYNKKWKVANWVGYELTREETYGNEKRTNKFVTDPLVPGGTSFDSDYKGSGYDRGHLAPAADMAWSNDAMRESFYFSNMTPQSPNLNRGIWKSLEDKTRQWARRDSAIYVICGPLMNDTSKTIGKNQVLVPSGFFKVILSPYGRTPKAIAFLFKNEGSLKTLNTFAVSVDSIEALTGIDFFYQLPDTMESRIERSFNMSEWF